MVDLSVVIAVCNEEENIDPLIEKIRESLRGCGTEYEIIFVDDGSTDKTAEMIRANILQDLILVELKRNFGQSAALQAGIDQATGCHIAFLDGDLQNDPADLPMMLRLLKEKDCDIVTGIRSDRQDDLFLRKIPSYVANYIVRKVTRTKITDNGCGIKIFKSEILKEIPLYGERHRFLVALAALEGATIEQVKVNHLPRIHNKSKYGLGRTMKVVSDLILMSFLKRYGQKPMYLYGKIGFITFLSGAIILLWMLAQKILGADIWGRPLLILGVIFMFIGFQVISTGLILDALIRNDYESNAAKPYKIRRISRGE